METQGISLVTSKMSDQMTVRKMQASDSSFDSFMTDRTSKAGAATQKNSSNSEKRVDTKTADPAGNSVSLKKDSSATTRNMDTKDAKMPVVSKGNELEETVDPAVVEWNMISALQEVFGLSMDALQDIMKQSGMSMKEVLGSLSTEDMTETIQNLVMDVHGITDKAAFLTNDTLVQELNTLNDRFTQILTDASSLTEDLTGMDPSVLVSMADLSGRIVQPESEPVTADVDPNQTGGFLMEESGPGFEVIVEESQSEGSDAQTETFADRRDTEVDVKNHDTTAANLFTDRLAEAFEASAGEEAASARDVMTHIVEQVVNQVKIRVMPETTNMEIMLHPESLGRVSIHVSATAGVAKATLLVENLMAKEALESQLITLKQTFEEQGLKVDAVEVTVSEFGLNQENRQTQQEQKNGSKNRRFRLGAEEEGSLEEGAPEVQAERRDRNSLVDYTA